MNERESQRLWRKLSDQQRNMLVDSNSTKAKQYSWFIVTNRALERLGLLAAAPGWGRQRSRLGQELVDWAIGAGVAVHDPELKTWTFTEPPNHRRVDPVRLAELAAAGLCGSEIAIELQVTRQAISTAAQRLGIVIQRKPTKVVKPKPVRQPKDPRSHRIAVMLTDAEMTALREEAKCRGMSLSSAARSRIVGPANEDLAG